MSFIEISSPLFQWDTGRRITINSDISADEIHFSKSKENTALVVKPYEENGVLTADIPNILLQTEGSITAYAVTVSDKGEKTIYRKILAVNKRKRPDDYVYTETEVLNYSTLDKKITDLENNLSAEVDEAVEHYMAENPVEAPVQSVYGKTGDVKLTTKDIGAISQDDL